MRSKSIVLSFLLSLTLVACGGDDGDDGGNGGDTADASVGQPDSSTDTPDAGSTGGSALGQACTGAGQGDCPDGFTCLPLQTGAWCSKTCGSQTPTPMVDDSVCTDGYEGPGAPRCFLGIQGGEEPDDNIYCAVACEETNPGTVCTTGTCDGTCPGDLECTGSIQDQNMNEVGKSCQ